MAARSRPVALTIAGSDSGGGAGIQADLKTFVRYGVFGTSVITAVTAQNTLGVRAWEAVGPSLVRAQIDAVAEDLRPAAVKSGMLGDASVVLVVAEAVRLHELTPYVLDPVMVATSGDPLVTPDAIRAIVERLIPLASLVTPNLDEAAILVGGPVRDADTMERAARRIVHGLGARAALVKGGHLSGHVLVDVLYDGRGMQRFVHDRVETDSTHGTGCTLSAAIAAGLALGRPMADAVESGLAFVRRGLTSAPRLGAGHGPLDHWA